MLGTPDVFESSFQFTNILQLLNKGYQIIPQFPTLKYDHHAKKEKKKKMKRKRKRFQLINTKLFSTRDRLNLQVKITFIEPIEASP